MGKRFFVSLLLVILVVALISGIAIWTFSTDYDALSGLQSQATATAQTTLPIVSDTQTEDSAASDQTEAEPTEETSTAEEETAAAATVTADSAADTQAEALLAEMSLYDKICQMLFITPEALTGYSRVTQSGSVTQAAIEEYPVGGIIYFASNLVSVDQTSEMIANIQTYARASSGIGLFIGVDEEGGSVARLADNLGTTAFDDMSVYGALGDTQTAYDIGATLARELKNLGFNVDFAPVADVLTNEDNTVVKDRSFGSDPELVASMVSQEVLGFVENGILCAPKHFPGHGSTGGDTHDGFAASERTLEELEACDLLPFQAAIEAGAPMIMVGHMTMTEIDSDYPASLSSTIITGILREQMGYDGIVITDSMSMSAITDLYTDGEAALLAIDAGCDMLLCVTDVDAVIEAVTEAVENGDLDESRIDESVLRILSAKIAYGIIS